MSVPGSRNASRVAVAMLGARRHYAVPRALAAAGMLDSFYTDLFVPGGWSRILGAAGSDLRRLGQRTEPSLPRGRVRTFILFGLFRAALNRWATTPSRRMRAYLAWNRRFCELVLSHWPKTADAVYGFNGAALELLDQAKRIPWRTVLDQTAAPWTVEEQLLAEERSRWPGWEFEGAARGDWQPLAERESREWQLADRIVCGSEYVRASVEAAGGPAAKCIVVPYGIEPDSIRAAPRERHSGPLRVLFVGTVQLRKGIQYLAEAAQKLPPDQAVIRAVGAVRVSEAARREIAQHIDLVGALPRGEVARQYDWADVLVAPSISEGSANVCYEALAAGLPVVTTPNAGSVVRDGRDGFVVPIRSGAALAEKIACLAEAGSPIERLSAGALDRAREYSFANYAARLVSAVAGSPAP